MRLGSFARSSCVGTVRCLMIGCFVRRLMTMTGDAGSWSAPTGLMIAGSRFGAKGRHRQCGLRLQGGYSGSQRAFSAAAGRSGTVRGGWTRRARAGSTNATCGQGCGARGFDSCAGTFRRWTGGCAGQLGSRWAWAAAWQWAFVLPTLTSYDSTLSGGTGGAAGGFASRKVLRGVAQRQSGST